jgi:hypothetical protein
LPESVAERETCDVGEDMELDMGEAVAEWASAAPRAVALATVTTAAAVSKRRRNTVFSFSNGSDKRGDAPGGLSVASVEEVVTKS